jgi:excisionase family DNA binding protein
MAQEVMTVETLAGYLKVHRSTVYRLCKNSTLPKFKIGSDWRFLRSAIDAWLLEGGSRQVNGFSTGGKGGYGS